MRFKSLWHDNNFCILDSGIFQDGDRLKRHLFSCFWSLLSYFLSYRSVLVLLEVVLSTSTATYKINCYIVENVGKWPNLCKNYYHVKDFQISQIHQNWKLRFFQNENVSWFSSYSRNVNKDEPHKSVYSHISAITATSVKNRD